MSKSVLKRTQEFLKNNPIISNDQIKNHPHADCEKKDPIWSILQKIKIQSSSSNQKSPSQPFEDDYIHLLLYVRNLFKESYITIEGEDLITQKSWSSSESHGLQGGGIMTVMRGSVLEKSAVNISVVSGAKYPGKNTGAKNDEHYSGKPFVAAGVSLISHPKNPLAPIMHFNIRMIKVFGEHKVYQWIGGGADLTPMQTFSEDTKEFHDTLKRVCQKNSDIADYEHFKKWADEYFYIPHRKEARGIGGIFFDFIPIESTQKTELLLDLGQSVAHTYANILSRRVDLSYTEDLVKQHQYWRGRYAEFNLIYDRGTRFGLMSGGNHEAIFCSLPPQVRW